MSSFGKALEALKKGRAIGIRLPHWKAVFLVRIQKGDPLLTVPYLYKTGKKSKYPWMPTYLEMFSNNWEIITEENQGQSQLETEGEQDVSEG